jgi:hypothetical protein
LETRTPRAFKLRAWAGSPSDIERLMASAQDVLRDDRDRDLARLEVEKQEVLALDDLTEAGRSERLSELESRYRLRWAGRAQVLDGKTRQEHSGEISEILRDGDTSSFSRITMWVPFAGTQNRTVRISFDKEFGLSVRVEGDSSSWAEGAKIALLNEANRRKPPWAILRSWWAMLLVSASVLITAVLFGRAYIQPDEPDSWLRFYLPPLLGVLAAVLVTSDGFYRYLLPPFELHLEGATPAGTRHIVWFATLLVGAFVGAIASILLS